MQITIELTSKSINDAIKKIANYQKKMESRMVEFTEKLLEVGIKTAKANISGDYAPHVIFYKEIEDVTVAADVGETSVTGLLIGKDGDLIERSWKYGNDIKTVQVSGLYMSEFGSGWLASVLDDVEGVGQGTFPGQIHAFDPDGWWWTTPDGEKHHSYGEAPTHPMHAAVLAMLFEVDSIAKAVFAGD